MDKRETIYTLTQKHYDRLCEAIERAESPGACSYVAGCVVGQLARLEGASERTLKRWDGGSGGGGSIDVYALKIAAIPGIGKLKGYPVTLLALLQTSWDNADFEDDESIEDVRKRLRAVFDANVEVAS